MARVFALLLILCACSLALVAQNPLNPSPVGPGGGGSAGIGGTLCNVDNTLLATDGTGGATAQCRDLTVSDVAASTVTVATTAGNGLAVNATAPAATTGASQAGKPITITGSAAVASTDTAGAAAGGSVTITGGDAARLTSGNAAGGDVTLMGGAGIGTGASGRVLIGQKGSNTTPAIGNSTDTDTGFYWHANDNRILVTNGGTATWIFGASGELAQAANTAGRPYLNGGGGPPVYTFNADTDTGVGRVGVDSVALYAGGSAGITLTNAASVNTTAILGEVQSYTVGSGATDYERLALQGATGYVEVAAETGGTGADNVDIRLTPAGTGMVKASGKMVMLAQFGEITATPDPATPIVTPAVTVAGTYVEVAPTTSLTSGASDFDQSANGRLRYTGAMTQKFHCAATLSYKGGSASSDVIGVTFGDNGTPIAGAKAYDSATNANIESTALHAAIELAQNEYVSIWITNETDTDDPAVHSLNVFCMAAGMN